MLTYCDSSAVVVLLRPDEAHREPLVASVLEDASDVVGTDRITPLEVTAAIHRGLPPDQRGAAESRWRTIWAGMVPVGFDQAVFELALTASRQHGLRSLDAIHLAAALRIGCARLLTFDLELAAAAQGEGIEVVDTAD